MLDQIRNRRTEETTDPNDSLQSIRDSYRQRLPHASQWFLIESQNALARLNQFKDKSKIEAFLDTMEVSFDDCDFETLQINDDVFFRIAGKSKKHSNAAHQFMLVMDQAGQLTQTLTTKG